jgi:hypothetical protein
MAMVIMVILTMNIRKIGGFNGHGHNETPPHGWKLTIFLAALHPGPLPEWSLSQ